MKSTQGRIQRQGKIYRFTVADAEYAVFIWQMGMQYRGRVEGNPQVPEQTGRTVNAVRDALREWLVAHVASA